MITHKTYLIWLTFLYILRLVNRSSSHSMTSDTQGYISIINIYLRYNHRLAMKRSVQVWLYGPPADHSAHRDTCPAGPHPLLGKARCAVSEVRGYVWSGFCPTSQGADDLFPLFFSRVSVSDNRWWDEGPGAPRTSSAGHSESDRPSRSLAQHDTRPFSRVCCVPLVNDDRIHTSAVSCSWSVVNCNMPNPGVDTRCELCPRTPSSHLAVVRLYGGGWMY